MNEENLKEQAEQIAEIFLKSLEQALPGHKIHITYSVFKDDETDIWGGYKNTEGMTLKEAAFLQCFNIAQQFVNSYDDDDE